MSNITINMCSDVTTQREHPPKKQNLKSKNFHKKMRHLEAKGYLRGKQNRNHNPRDIEGGQTPRQNGSYQKSSTLPAPSASHNRTLPHPHGAYSFKSQLFGSTHSLPSTTSTVNKSDDHKPKELLSTKAQTSGPSTSSHKPCTKATGNPNKYLAIDCEMVGTGPKGSISQLARCSIVSYEGDVIYDKYINPAMPVTDYRTRWSGIRPRDLIKATPYSEARKEILKLLMGKVIIGHAIHNDFKALSYFHPTVLTRDTSKIPLLNVKAGFGAKECVSLKRLTKALLNRDIQNKKGHSSVEDAKATMELYKVVEGEWEKTLLSNSVAS
ncbi:interferon-stimulated 20 kDa exonuclease-like 2 [Oryzias melastigma]|uniref:Interferon stimulated exonuclease 20 like 2 n=1 Tax=Oryzias melastigma TaxID=30732 RepID=A0A3B3CSG6_ORYME|nr:interferon-stimulated 20 kDa exonuclease-like 2 [Oryzias melastigma]